MSCQDASMAAAIRDLNTLTCQPELQSKQVMNPGGQKW
jgi:hypothetical protein